MGSLLDTEGIMNHVTALVCVLCLAVGARALPSYDVDDVVAEESFKETASVNSILQEMVEAPQDALQKQQLQAPETLLQTGSAADPCAEKCLSGTCDSPADAHKPECAECVACHTESHDHHHHETGSAEHHDVHFHGFSTGSGDVHHFHDHYGGASSGFAPTPAPTDVCASDKCAPGCPCKNAAYELKHFPKTASPLPAGCPKCPTTAEEVLLQDDHYVVPEPTTHYYTPPPMTHHHVETGSAEHVHDVHFHGFSTGSGDDHHFHGAGSGFTPTPAPTDVCASDKCAAGCPCKNAAWMAKFDAPHHPNAPATPLPAGCPKCDVSLQDVPASFLVNRPKLLGKLKASLLGESTKNHSYYSPTPSYYSPSPSYWGDSRRRWSYSPSPSYYSPSPSYHSPTPSFPSPSPSYWGDSRRRWSYSPSPSYYSPSPSYYSPSPSY